MEIVERYDIECVPEIYRSNKVAYIKNSLITKKCDHLIKVNFMPSQLFILENYGR